jgi:hypothetical protein
VVAAGRSGAFALLVGVWLIAGPALVTPSGVTALATTVLAGVLVAVLALGGWIGRTAASGPLISRAAALRQKSWSAAFVRLRDPDAAGKSRPRAPSAGPAAV